MLRKINALILLIGAALNFTLLGIYGSKPSTVKDTGIASVDSQFHKMAQDYNFLFYSLIVSGCVYVIVAVLYFITSKKVSANIFDILVVIASVIMIAAYSNIMTAYPAPSDPKAGQIDPNSLTPIRNKLSSVSYLLSGKTTNNNNNEYAVDIITTYGLLVVPVFEVFSIIVIRGFYLASKYL